MPTETSPANLDRQTLLEHDWVSLPGGELEAPRPRALCPACRERLRQSAVNGAAGETATRPKTLCFHCYRADLDRQRRLRAAGRLNTASEARFQCTLPFEPVNHARLNQLRAAREEARRGDRQGLGRFIDERKHAQIAARHALRGIVEGLEGRGVPLSERVRTIGSAVHAAELQLPEAWLPFVIGQ